MTEPLFALNEVSKRIRWIGCVMVALLSNAACSAQAPETPVPKPSENVATKVPPGTASDRALQAGEYATEKGWGRLQLDRNGGNLSFSIETLVGEDICALNGTIKGSRGIAADDTSPSACAVAFTQGKQGVEISASTPAECKRFCGDNGGFDGVYLKVKDGCSQNEIQRTRDAFNQFYENEDFKPALAKLSPVLKECLPTLEWEEEGSIRNDLAIAQYRNGLYDECLRTLGPYAEDSSKDDDAVMEEWAPALADRYLSIIKAARTNIALCSKHSKKK